jgi:hypothetical protein
MWQTLKFGFWAQFLAPIWFAAFWEASVHQLPLLHIAAFVVLGLEIVMLGTAVHHLRVFHRSAEAFLGVHVGWNDLPSSEAKFRQWCEAKGIPAP